MGLTESISVCFKKYATFEGRASRSEYWYFTLFLFLISILGSIVENAVTTEGANLIVSGVTLLITLATLMPSISVAARRLHDLNRTGWWLLLPNCVAIFIFIAPMFGLVAFLIIALGFVIYLAREGSFGKNDYGEDPIDRSRFETPSTP